MPWRMRGEPDFGTDSERLWLLRSRPDQFHRRTMRRGPPNKSLTGLAQLRGRRRGIIDPHIDAREIQSATGWSAIQRRHMGAIALHLFAVSLAHPRRVVFHGFAFGRHTSLVVDHQPVLLL